MRERERTHLSQGRSDCQPPGWKGGLFPSEALDIGGETLARQPIDHALALTPSIKGKRVPRGSRISSKSGVRDETEVAMPAAHQTRAFLIEGEALVPDQRAKGEEPHLSFWRHRTDQGRGGCRVVAVRPRSFAVEPH